jgi:hypothetical protein
MTDRRGSSSTDHTTRDRLARVRRWWNSFLVAHPPWVLEHHSEKRAVKLLKQNLSPLQREQYDKGRFFDVIGGSSGTRYRIRQGYQMNVEQLDPTGKRTHLLCFIPEGHLALADIMLAQKLALELFEDDALIVANKISHDPRRFGLR